MVYYIDSFRTSLTKTKTKLNLKDKIIVIKYK